MLVNRAKKRALSPQEQKMFQMNLMRMRMCCDAAQLVDPHEKTPSPKLQELEKLLPELLDEPGRKVVIFSEWVKMLDLVVGLLKGAGIGFEYLQGSVPTKKRGPLLDRFAGDPNCRVLLSTEAGGVGLNLQAASWVINLDLPWNPAKLDQRIARVHRHGQKQAVNVINLVAEGVIEENMLELHARKKALYKGLVDADSDVTELPLPSLRSEEDLELMKRLLGMVPGRVDAVTVSAAEAARARAAQAAGTSPEAPPGAQGGQGPDSTAPASETLPAGAAPTAAFPGAAPATQALAAQIHELLAPRLEDALKHVHPLPGGVAVVAETSAIDEDRRKLVSALARDLGVEAVLLDPATFEQMRRIFGDGARGPVPPGASEDPLERRARESGDRAQARIKASRWLLDGAMPADSVRSSLEAMEAAIDALLARQGAPSPNGEILRSVYTHLVRPGRMDVTLAAGLSRARDLAALAASGAGDLVDLPSARAVLSDAETLVSLSGAQ